MRNWKIMLIHHSHTDIGYTEYQERLEMYHVDYIRMVLDILSDIDEGRRPGCEGFKWQCENHWQIDNFYRSANDAEKELFEGYVRTGRIGLSGNYLNMTELVDEPTLTTRLAKGRAFAERTGAPMKSGMSADINGYAWGFADALSGAGVENLFCALHSHHGMFPMGHNPSFCYWEGPKGGKVLLFVGEHYHLGNELGFVPHNASSYIIYDDVRCAMNRRELFCTDAETTYRQELALAKTRVSRYLDGLEASGYPINIVPIMVSGVISDNAAPNAEIARRAKELEAEFGDSIRIEMATLDDFFTAFRATGVEIPTFTGDFTDWWADGVGSTPAAVKLYREAQRYLRLSAKLDPETKHGDTALIEDARENLMLYAEHTWGYSTSISEPWNSMVAGLGMKKTQYAVSANIAAYRNLNRILYAMGQKTPYADRPHRTRIVNPHPFTVSDRAVITLEHWENIDGLMIDRMRPVVLRNVETGEILPSQMRPSSRGTAVETALTLAAGEAITVEAIFGEDPTASVPHTALYGADGVRDFADTEGMETPFEIDTRFFHVQVAADRGITSIYDKTHAAELIDAQAGIGPFTGVYEVTRSGELAQTEVRRRMGRNRCSIATKRDTARLIDARITESGDVYVIEKLSYELSGTQYYDVYLKLYKTIPLIEARVCMLKDVCLDPENLYVALPFTAGGRNETFIDKTGCVVRPGIDQLPGTCRQFYLTQNGLARRGTDVELAVACKDAPLMVFGPREAAPIRLHEGEDRAFNASAAYSWVMNNFWETNFEANLGGPYEFFYTLTTTVPGMGLDMCSALNEGFAVFEV